LQQLQKKENADGIIFRRGRRRKKKTRMGFFGEWAGTLKSGREGGVNSETKKSHKIELNCPGRRH